jgi:hypothetical protein
MSGRRGTILATIAIIGTALATFLTMVTFRYYKWRPILLTGAVVKKDGDPMRESPISDVEISEAHGLATENTKSTFSGYFAIRLRRGMGQNESVTLRFRHPDYQPLDVTQPVGHQLAVVHLIPARTSVIVPIDRPAIRVSEVRIRYSTEATTQENIGTGVKTFEVENIGNVPCYNSSPCSPDQTWKAAVGSESLDAGEGSVYRNARVSCIAGPCPFTRIDSDGFSHGGRYISVTVRNWSETTTFLMQAEVFRPEISNIVRLAYPLILGTSLNFTLPPSADGPSIEAELNGEDIVFPLGPKPVLSWADCDVSADKNRTKIYRCELKAGYRFSKTQ